MKFSDARSFEKDWLQARLALLGLSELRSIRIVDDDETRHIVSRRVVACNRRWECDAMGTSELKYDCIQIAMHNASIVAGNTTNASLPPRHVSTNAS
jgi:hypothetical protein